MTPARSRPASLPSGMGDAACGLFEFQLDSSTYHTRPRIPHVKFRSAGSNFHSHVGAAMSLCRARMARTSTFTERPSGIPASAPQAAKERISNVFVVLQAA